MPRLGTLFLRRSAAGTVITNLEKIQKIKKFLPKFFTKKSPTCGALFLWRSVAGTVKTNLGKPQKIKKFLHTFFYKK
jgi:hypothetical protein